MTEEEWLACEDPKLMLRFLLGTNERVQDLVAFPRCKGSARKLRLFACACYHRIRHLLPDELARACVETAERVADGVPPSEEFRQAESRLRERLKPLEERMRVARGKERVALLPTYAALALALQVVLREAPKAAYYASSNAYLHGAEIMNPGASRPYDRAMSESRMAEERAQTDLLRDIFGTLPFRPGEFAPHWRTDNVVALARTIYEERCFDRLPILADALLDAGCDSEAILSHCRSSGSHVRGCWVIDLLLGKG